MIDNKLDNYIVNFYKKAKTIIIAINDLLIKNSTVDIEPFMNKIYKIDKIDDISSLTAIDLLNQIKNVELEEYIEVGNKNNDTYYNVNKMDYILKNTTNPVVNVGINELTPGDLNSIKRITQLLNLNINSCFRNNYYQSNPTDFLYTLPVEIKNVSSIRLVSIEIPNSWYLFSSKKTNKILDR